jgi:hypothetical protein
MNLSEQEIREAVLAECGRLCPNVGSKHHFDWGYVYCWEKHWTLNNKIGGQRLFSTKGSDYNPEHSNWLLAYRMLGLESRALESRALENRIKQLEAVLQDIAGIDADVRKNYGSLHLIPTDAWVHTLGYVVGRAQAALGKSANGGEPQTVVEGRTVDGC